MIRKSEVIDQETSIIKKRIPQNCVRVIYDKVSISKGSDSKKKLEMKYQVNFLLAFLALILALNYICEAGGGPSMKRRNSARNLNQDSEQHDKPLRLSQEKRSAKARSINFGNQGRQSSKDVSARAFDNEASGRLIGSSRRQFGGVDKPRNGKKRIQRSSRRQLTGVSKARGAKKRTQKSRSFQPHNRSKRAFKRDCDCFGMKTVGQEIGVPIESALTSDMRKHDLNRAFDVGDDFGKLFSKLISCLTKLSLDIGKLIYISRFNQL